MIKPKFRSCIVILLVLILLLPIVSATGIRPAKTNLDHTTKTYSDTFWIVNNDAREFSVTMKVEGEMGQYVTIDTDNLNFRSDEDAKPVDFSVALPSQVPPGVSSAFIVVEEDLTASGSVVASRIVLKHKILIQGEYPDKFITMTVNFHDQGQEIGFVSEVENLGKKAINSVQTAFYVNGIKAEQEVLETESTSLALKEKKLLRASFSKNLLQQGEFEVNAITTFDGEQVEVIKNLINGQPEIDVTYFDKYFIANKVNQYSLDLLNKWNKQLKNVFVDVAIKKEDKKIDEFRTKSVDIEGEMTERIQDYLDAEDIKKGTYSFEMMVNFWNLVRDEQRTFTFESEFVSEEDAQKIKNNQPLVGAATGEVGGTYTILFWLLLGLVLGATGFYIIYRYSHKDQYEGGEDAL